MVRVVGPDFNIIAVDDARGVARGIPTLRSGMSPITAISYEATTGTFRIEAILGRVPKPTPGQALGWLAWNRRIGLVRIGWDGEDGLLTCGGAVPCLGQDGHGVANAKALILDLLQALEDEDLWRSLTA